MTRSTPTLTLTQSGLLAVLLQRQRYAVIQLARRRAHRQHLRAVLWSNLTWLLARAHSAIASRRFRRAFVGTVPRAPHLNLSPKPIAMSPQIHTYTELRQQIHDDLRNQHPEWVKSNGECPTCDSYESRLTEMLDTLTRTGSNGSIAATPPALDFWGAELAPKVRAGQFSPNQTQITESRVPASSTG